MRTGLYGGSFDPIHRGHIAAAEAVLLHRALDRVFLIPAGSPPHKPGGCVATFEQRMAMARLAAASIHGIEVVDWEGQRSGPSYTRDTIEEAQRRYPDDSFELLLGADMVADLPNWKDPAWIVKNAGIAAFARPGESFEEALAKCREGLPGAAVHPVKIPAIEASSTHIRALLASGRSADAFLEPSVAKFIAERALYGG